MAAEAGGDTMTDDLPERYSVAEAGTHVWHIPGADGTPLCGVQLTRRYLPAAMAPDAVLCEACTAIWRQRQDSETMTGENRRCMDPDLQRKQKLLLSERGG